MKGKKGRGKRKAGKKSEKGEKGKEGRGVSEKKGKTMFVGKQNKFMARCVLFRAYLCYR